MNHLNRAEPKRPYKSLAEFRVHAAWNWSKDFLLANPDKYPCLKCRGAGRIYDPDDPPCPVEGNKMRDRITCPKCCGSKCSPRKEFAAAYRSIINDYLKAMRRHRLLTRARRIALLKLSAIEREALSVLGV